MPWAPVAHEPGEGLDDDPTPRGVVRAVLRAALRDWLFRACGKGHPIPGAVPNNYRPMLPEQFESHPVLGLQLPSAMGASEHLGPLRVLGIGSGYGCWESEFRKLAHAQGWPVHITGVELNPKREPHLRKWCDEVVTRDWFDALRDHHELPTWDLAIGNPPFCELLSGEPGGGYELDDAFTGEDWPLGMPGWLLEHCTSVLLLHTQQAFLKSEAGRACWRRHPPAASWLVPGGVKFRGPGEGADSRCYQVTLWLRGHTGPCSVHLLDDLTAAERQWTVPPGSETIAEARAQGWPLAPGVA
jgi:hypothetical protein